MMQDIIIPWRDTGEPWRSKHFHFLLDHYSKDFNIIIGDSEENLTDLLLEIMAF